jgi:hypothetical protein
VVIWYIFSRFGKLYLEKSGNRAASRNWNKSCSLTFDAEEGALMPKKKQNIFFGLNFFSEALKSFFNEDKSHFLLFQDIQSIHT